ncbi:MAG: hypothetical protein ACRETA_12595 [Gammaproteobacteria bacterium]
MDNALKAIIVENNASRMAFTDEKRRLMALEQIGDALEGIHSQLIMIANGVGETPHAMSTLSNTLYNLSTSMGGVVRWTPKTG